MEKPYSRQKCPKHMLQETLYINSIKLLVEKNETPPPR
jgi:hypothetical protein